MERIELLDVVELIKPLSVKHWETGERLNLHRGETGTVMEVLTPDTFLVDFSDDDGVTYAMPVLHSDQLQSLRKPNLVGAA